MKKKEKNPLPLPGERWPEPRVRALQVEELYRFAPMATGFSYFGALLTLGVLIEIGDIGRGAVWFLWATAVTVFRSTCIVAYRRRGLASHPEGWSNLVIAANYLSGVQWGVLGTLLFPDGPVYLQLFTLMVIICFVAGSVPAYASVRGAHEALSLPATVPTSIYLFFCFAIVFYSRRLSGDIEHRLRLQIERDDLLTLTGMLNEKLERENRDLAHRVAVRGASMCRSRNSGEKRSNSLICSSVSSILRSAVACSSRSNRSCLVSRPLRCHTPRMPPAETWTPLSRSSCSTRTAPWQGLASAWSSTACSISADTRFGCGPLAPGRRSISPSAP